MKISISSLTNVYDIVAWHSQSFVYTVIVDSRKTYFVLRTVPLVTLSALQATLSLGLDFALYSSQRAVNDAALKNDLSRVLSVEVWAKYATTLLTQIMM